TRDSRASPGAWAAMAPSSCSASPSTVQSGLSGAPRTAAIELTAVTVGLPVLRECAIPHAILSARFRVRNGSRHSLPGPRRLDRRRQELRFAPARLLPG